MSVGAGRSLAEPSFPGDDGSADPRVRAGLRDASVGAVDALGVVRSLRGSRLLSSVVAVLDAAGDDGDEKDSHMAVVSMVNARGERGLLAFSGTDSLAAWNPDARPVPAFGRDIARAAQESGATAVVVDVAGPSTLVVAGPLLRALADDLHLIDVTARVQEVLAPAMSSTAAEVVDTRAATHGLPSADVTGFDPADVDVVIVLQGEGRASAAALLEGDAALRDLVPGGLAICLAG